MPDIPPAPPLPPQRFYARGTNALVRFAQPFIGGGFPSGHARGPEDSSAGRALPPTSTPRVSSPVSSRTISHKTGLPITALAMSPSRSHVVLAGRDIFKTLRVSPAGCAEEYNLRGAIVAYSSTAFQPNGTGVLAKHKDQLAASDVSWSHGSFANMIATAAANGRVVLYDINRPGAELARLHQHHRQVHKISFNPHQGFFLLSGSQDATMKLWDLRDLSGGRNVMTLRNNRNYKANAEGVRDVTWSPTDGVMLACGTDNGAVQSWDLRKENAPLLKINAHDKNCSSIDWHPDGKHLISAGADKEVKVWELTSGNRRQKPKTSFRTPHVANVVRWRPPTWRSKSKATGSMESTHVVTAYNDRDSRVHVWDFRRPHIPYCEIDRFPSAPTDLLWHSETLLWTVGNEGVFTQSDLHFESKSLDHRSFQALDWAPQGNMTFCSQERPRRRASDSEPAPTAVIIEGGRRKSGGDKLGASRSATDDAADEGLISSSFRRRHSRRSSAKSIKSAGGTPPSASNGLPVAYLDEVLKQSAPFKSAQVMASGHVAGTSNHLIFEALMSHYHFDLSNAIQQRLRGITPEFEGRLDERVDRAMRHNARVAEHFGMFRLSQTWLMLAYVVKGEMAKRAERQRAIRFDAAVARLRKAQQKSKENGKKAEARTSPDLHEDTDRMRSNPSIRALSAAESQPAKFQGSTSNMNTPVARPARDPLPIPRSESFHLSDLDAENDLSLPPSSMASSVNLKRYYRHDYPMHDNQHEGMYREIYFTNEYRSGQASRRLTRDSRRARNNHLYRFDPSIENQYGTQMQGSSESLHMFPESAPRSYQSDATLGSSPEEWRKPPKLLNPSVGSSNSGPINNSMSIPRSISYPRSNGTGFRSGLSFDESEPDELLSPPEEETIPLELKNEILSALKNSPESSVPLNLPLPPFIDVDFLPKSTDSGELEKPWSSKNMLFESLRFLTTTLTDTQSATAIILLLDPIMRPRKRRPPGPHPPEVHSAQTLQYIAIVGAYHEELISNRHFGPAAVLRKLLASSPHAPVYDSIVEPWSTNVYIPLGCGNCHKPFANTRTNRDIWACERCSHMQGACMVCGHRAPGGKLWMWCQGCAHGGHTDCLQSWFDATDADGVCCFDGCRHDCRPGARRDQKRQERVDRVAFLRERSRNAPVRRDGWDVDESRAVERTRGVLSAPYGRRVKVLRPSEERTWTFGN
ncbi:MAG: SEA (Seh1-associated) complex subunit [Trizodia sp. TS-e1964]|nr:MAG: SEA (Seh1-associated) complex subunit [Trizodia sp. TS-e1964]